MRRRTLLRLKGTKMQDVQCPAPIDATDTEIAVCAAKEPTRPLKPKEGEVKPLGGGGGTTNPKDPPKPPTDG